MRVPLTLACWDYDRTLPLATGDIRPDGIDLTYLNLPVEETFFRMARYREFDAAELSLSSYVISLGQDAPFIAIPVFPSRAFRHNGIYVSAASGIRSAAVNERLFHKSASEWKTRWVTDPITWPPSAPKAIYMKR